MSAAELLDQLREQGVELWAEGDRLRYRAPRHVLTPALVERMKRHKAEIVALVAARPTGPGRQRLPLSHGQRALWYLHQVAPESSAYNVAFTARVRSRLDVDALRTAIGMLVDRHASLRASFPLAEGVPVQHVHLSRPMSIAVTDARLWNPTELAARVQAAYERPFDLDAGPLLRADVFECGDEDHVLLVVLHHIAVDFWSLTLLVDALGEMYSSLASGDAPRLSPPTREYTDYVAWQAEWMDSAERARQLAFWQETLAGELPVLNLPLDRQRPPVRRNRGASHGFRLDPSLADAVRRVARGEQATVFMTLLTAFVALLRRYTGQRDLVIGTLTAGRDRSEFTDVVGYFVNPVVLRCVLPDDPTFRALLSRIRRLVLDVMRHQDLPFPALVDRFAPDRDPSLTPIFQVLFALHKPRSHAAMMELWGPGGSAARIAWAGLELEPFILPQQEGQFDLTLEMMEGDEALFGFFKYNPDLFDARTIARMEAGFQTLLRHALDEPDCTIARLRVLPEAERRRLLVEWNATPGAPPDEKGLLHRLFEARAAAAPAAIAVIDRDATLTFAELNDRADRLAAALRSIGVGPEALVAVCLPRTADLVVGLLAILKAGGAYVPIDPAYPLERLRFVLSDSGARVVLTQTGLREAVEGQAAHVLCVDDAAGWPVRPVVPASMEREPSAENLAYVLYTSGSTGVPKGVAITHRSVVAFLRWAGGVFAREDLAGVLASTSICFDLSVFELFMPLVWGGALVLADNALALPSLPHASDVTLVNTVPSAMVELMRERALPASVRIVNLAGEPFSGELARAILAQPGVRAFYNLYGPSETTTYSTFARIEQTTGGAQVIGRPIANTRVYVLDGELQPTPIGVAGELYIGGAGLARGYVGRPGLTAERFIPDPFSALPGARLYRTGDLVRYLADGNLEFLGRLDRQVKVRGFRIEPREIEARLLRRPDVRGALVVARADARGSRRLLAYVIPAPGCLFRADALRADLCEHLPDHMVPPIFIALEQWPLTPNGKIDYRALPEPELGQCVGTDVIAPRTDVERTLAAIWREVLGIPRDPGVHERFFELGGDSILAMLVVARARRAGIDLTPRHVAQHPTIAALAEAAVVATVPTAEQGVVVGDVPLTPIQHWFFEHQPGLPHHFNQSVLLETPPGLDPVYVRLALGDLAAHHDALRLRFTRLPAGWTQTHADVARAVALQVEDLSSLREVDAPRAVIAGADEAQRGLDLTHGPIVRATLFHLGAERPGRLLLAVHHLAVDSVSWRILIEDLNTLYDARRSGRRAHLPVKTSSFRQWAERLSDHARSPAIRAELGYWLAQSGDALFDDGASATAATTDAPGTFATLERYEVELDALQTDALLRQVPLAYGTQINDVLLTALARGTFGAMGARTLRIALESHGREPLFDDVDVSRTMGWFTSVFPVVLAEGPTVDPGEALRSVKERLRAIPSHGIGFGLLRYLGAAPDRLALAALREPDISFNYLGQVDRMFATEARLRPVAEPRGLEQGPDVRRRYAIDIVAAVRNGCLCVEWMFNGAWQRRETVARVAEQFLLELKGLIVHCCDPCRSAFTPSDFPAARLTAPALAALTRQLERSPSRVAGPAAPVRALVEDVYELSPVQQGMLFHSLYAPGSGVYVEQLTVRFTGIDAVRLEQAWRMAIVRHPVLRTSFHWVGLPKPVQVVHRDVEPSFVLEDWRGLSEEEARARLASRLREDRAKAFAFDRAPLSRWQFIRRGDDVTEMIWTCHHLLLDGWSLALLLGEVTRHARGLVDEAAVSPPAAPPPYRAYVAWLQHQPLGEAEGHFRGVLQGAHPSSVPGLVARDTRGAGAGAAHVVLDVDGARLAAFARSQGLTLNTLLQGAWAFVLARRTGATDVIWGTTVSHRPAALPSVERMVGPFINTLPLRARLDEDAPLLTWLHALQAQQMDAVYYASASLSDIQRWSGLPSGTPLFESIVVFENHPMEREVADAGVEIGDLEGLEHTNYPLGLLVVPTSRADGALTVRVIYDPQRVDGAAIGRLAAHLEDVLAAMPSCAAARLSDLPPLSADEWRLVGTVVNDTARPFATDVCVHRRFEAWAARTPDAPAVQFGDQSLSYRELNIRSNRLAHRLRALSAGPESRVAVCVNRSLELTVALLGVLKSGAAYVPLDPGYPPERLAFMLQDSGASVIVLGDGTTAAWPQRIARVVVLEASTADDGGDAEAPAVEVRAEDPAYVIYTSGSTGVPKGVVVTHQAINRLIPESNYIALSPADRIAQASNASFDAATFEIWGALLSGACIVDVPRETALSPDDLAAFIRDKRLSVLFLTTALFNQIAARAPAAFQPLRCLLFGGEAADPRRVADVLAAGAPRQLLHVYGPTECTTFSTWSLVTEVRDGATSVPIGQPIANTQIYVLDQARCPVPIGVPGELYIGGPGVARGYLDRPALTAERFVPDPWGPTAGARLYRTGDLVRFLASGDIEFLGRADHQVKLRGFRVELGEIEAILLRHPAVRQAVAIARENAGHKRLVAYVSLRAGETSDTAGVSAFLKATLPDYMVPSAIVALAELPLTPNGKIDRGALPALPDPHAGGEDDEFEGPRDRVEETLAGIWCDVLGAERVSIHDNFFELGGDSILSIQIVARAGEAGLHLSVKELFTHGTIAALARVVIPRLGPGEERSPLVGSAPLLPMQHWFFERERPARHYFNQSVLLELQVSLPVERIAEALAHLQAHHDALRQRWARSESGWTQHFEPPQGDVPLSHIDLSDVRPADRPAACATAIARLQSGLDLSHGPIWRAGLIRSGGSTPEPDRLCLLAHHLAVDTVSWSILCEDLDTALRQLADGQPVRLAPRSSSSGAWADRLRTEGVALARESLPYWLDRPLSASAWLLPPSTSASSSADVPCAEPGVASPTISLELDAEETASLLRELPRKWRAGIQDALVTALARALFAWTGERQVLIDLESHGREELWSDLNLSRTVGWFTAMFPVLIEEGAIEPVEAALLAVKERLRAVPHRGIGYGILRYLGDDSAVRGALAAQPRAAISVNYLGRRRSDRHTLFRYVDTDRTIDSSPEHRLDHRVTVIAEVVDDRLRVDITYREDTLDRSTIERLVSSLRAGLRALVAAARTSGASAYVPSDFPHAQLTSAGLESLLREIGADAPDINDPLEARVDGGYDLPIRDIK